MSNYIDNNPWAGLSSYEDPEKAKREGRKPKLFCGRDDESHQVMQLISSNIFVTFYGKSGTGKTSLLNAGVFLVCAINAIFQSASAFRWMPSVLPSSRVLLVA